MVKILLLVLSCKLLANTPNWNRCKKVTVDFEALGHLLEKYKQLEGEYPSTNQGLQALIEKGFIESEPTNSWNFKYLYRLLSNNSYELKDLGADNKSGGFYLDADFKNGDNKKQYIENCKIEKWWKLW